MTPCENYMTAFFRFRKLKDLRNRVARRPRCDLDTHHVPLYEALVLDLFDFEAPTIEAVLAQLKLRVQQFDISWTRTKLTLQHLAHSFTPDVLADIQWTFHEIRWLVDCLLDVQSWDFLCEVEYEVAHGDHLYELALYEQWCDDLTSSTSVWTTPPVQCPRIFFRERIVLHAYSGRRRPGDFQWYMEQLAVLPQHQELLILSVDLVIDSTWGDIGNVQTQEFWLTAIKNGWVLGMLSGAPLLHLVHRSRQRSFQPPWPFTIGPPSHQNCRRIVGHDLCLTARISSTS